MRFILLFAVLMGAFFFDYNSEEEDLDHSLVYIKNHFHPCIAAFLHQQSLLAAAQCFLPSFKVMVENFSKKFKDKTEKTIDSVQIIHYWNFTDSSKHFNKVPLILPKCISVNPGITKCTVSGLDWSTQNGAGKQFELKKKIKASLITKKECQKPDLGKVSRKSNRFVKFLKSFKKLCVETWKWYWLMSSAVTRFRGRKCRHFLGNNISLYIDIFQYIFCIQKIVYRMSCFYSL